MRDICSSRKTSSWPRSAQERSPLNCHDCHHTAFIIINPLVHKYVACERMQVGWCKICWFIEVCICTWTYFKWERQSGKCCAVAVFGTLCCSLFYHFLLLFVYLSYVQICICAAVHKVYVRPSPAEQSLQWYIFYNNFVISNWHSIQVSKHNFTFYYRLPNRSLTLCHFSLPTT